MLGNLFGTPQRVALGMGEESVAALREVGKLLAFLKEPEPPKGLKDAWQNTRPVFLQVMHMTPKERSAAPCQEIVWEGAELDLARLPVQTCWPGDVAPLITWGLTVTRGPLENGLVDVGHVLGVSDATATGFQEPREHVEDEERPGVTEVRRVVRGHAADIHRRDLALGTERIGAPPPCVVEP